MYNDYFGFSESPFNITPNSRFYFRTPSSEEALGILRHGIEARKGVIVVTGEPGTGKTLLLKFLVRDLNPKVRTVIVYNPHTDLDGLLRLLLNRLGLPAAAVDSTAMFDRLTDYFIEQRRNGCVICLLIDEAQDLDEKTLDELRLLSNLDFEDEALLPIVLLGQPELNNKLDQPSARRIKQRMALTRYIYPLIRKEVGPYINARLQVAKYQGNGLFDPEAIEKIAAYSGGIPRIVNSICDNSLIRAYTTNQSIISPKIVDQVARELRIAANPLVQAQPSPAKFSDFNNEPAPFADDTEFFANDLASLPAEEKPIIELTYEENLDTTAVNPTNSNFAALPHLPTTEVIRGFPEGDANVAPENNVPPKSDPDPLASADRLLPSQFSPVGFSDFTTERALIEYDAKSIANDVDVENPVALAAQQSSDAAAVRQPGTTENLRGHPDPGMSTATDREAQSRSSPDQRASSDGLPDFFTVPGVRHASIPFRLRWRAWPGIRHAFILFRLRSYVLPAIYHALTPFRLPWRAWSGIRHAFMTFRLRWYAVAAAIGSLMLIIGYIVSSSELEGIYSAVSTANRATVADAQLPQPQQTKDSLESNGVLVSPAAPDPANWESEQIQIAAYQPSEEIKAGPSDASTVAHAKNPETFDPAQPQPPPNTDFAHAQPATIPAGNGNENTPPAVPLEVVGATIVRAKPSDNAEIIGNLEPGSRVTVLAKSRDYYHIRSLDKKSIRGYVHREDAFFQGKK